MSANDNSNGASSRTGPRRTEYEPPQCTRLGVGSARGDCHSGSTAIPGNCVNGTSTSNDCQNGGSALNDCNPVGSSAGRPSGHGNCQVGTSAVYDCQNGGGANSNCQTGGGYTKQPRSRPS
jgi:hypothetical protein